MSGSTLLFLLGDVDGHSSSYGLRHGLSWYAVVMPAYCVEREREREVSWVHDFSPHVDVHMVIMWRR